MRAMVISGVIDNLRNLKGLESFGAGTSLGRKLEPLGMNNGFQVENCPLKQLVDYNEVEFPGLRHLKGGIFESQFDDFGAVFAAPLQAGAQLFPAWRQDENQYRIGKNPLDVDGALKINFKNHIGAMRHPLFNGLA
jgi:hypothetical protein